MQQPPQWGPQGYGPPPGYGYGPGYPPPPKKSNASGLIIGLAIGGALVVAVLIVIGARSKRAEKDAEVAIDVTADELASAYKKNEIAGDQKYKGKKLRVTGVVDGIDSDITDSAVVRLKAKGEFLGVSARGLPKDEAAVLEKGKTVIFECTGAGEVISSPQLRDCKVINDDVH
jgi:hypothetical protein